MEDDAILAQILTEHLTAQHYIVDTVTDGVAGFDYAQAIPYDLIVLDVNLPRLDGIRLCQLLRQNRYTLPILLLTAKGDSSDKVMGLDAGADDYVVKPCTVEEISARIRALLRRLTMVGTPVLTWGKICLDPVTCEVTCDGQPLSLSPKEYSLLELFLRNPQRIFSSSSILERLWSFEDAPGEETIRSHIKRLRRKLKASSNEEIIDTVYGMGYRLSVTLSAAPSASSLPEPIAAETIARSAAIGTWEKFKQPTLERVALLDQAIIALQAGHLPEGDRQAAAQAAHKLAGSLSLFGFPAGTPLGREIERLLQEPLPLSRIGQLKALVTELHQMLHHPMQSQEATATPQKAPVSTPPLLVPDLQMPHLRIPHLLIVDDDELVRQQLQTEGRTLGIQVTIASDPAQARQCLATATPHAVLLDLAFPDAAEDGFTLLAELTDQFPRLPVALFTSHDDFAHRLAGVRQGCDRFISKATPPAQVLVIMQELLRQKQQSGTTIRVLAVDDDPIVLNWLTQHLPQWGIHLTTLDTADAIWHKLGEATPDLVILDVQMPAVNGIDLCKVLRSDRTLERLPILFLTTCQEPEVIQQLYEAGADDYLSKPCTESEIVTRIFNRLQRNSCLQQTG